MKENKLLSILYPECCNIVASHEELYIVPQSMCNKKLLCLTNIGISNPDPKYEIFDALPRACDIEYVISGKGIIIEEDKIFHVCAGDTFIFYPERPRHYYSDPSDPWKKVFITFSGASVSNLLRTYLLGSVNRYEKLDTSAELMQIFSYAKESAQEDKTLPIILEINKLLKKLYDFTYKNDSDYTVEVMKEYLINHVNSPVSMDDFSRSFGKSKSQLTRLFKDSYGITPYNYLLQKRICVAQDMLANTSEPIKNIAAVLCFCDEYYFSAYFKTVCGMSPLAFRKKTGSLQQS